MQSNKYSHPLSRWLPVVDKCIFYTVTTIATASATIMLLSIIIGVFSRYVLKSALSWSDELAILMFVWTVFLFSSSLVRSDEHARITLTLDLLPKTISKYMECTILFVVFLFGCLMAFYGYKYMIFTMMQKSAAIRFPLWIQNSAIPVSGILFAYNALVRLLLQLSCKTKS